MHGPLNVKDHNKSFLKSDQLPNSFQSVSQLIIHSNNRSVYF